MNECNLQWYHHLKIFAQNFSFFGSESNEIYIIYNIILYN